MKKLCILFSLIFISILTQAQTTNVTATVVSPDGFPYANGTVTAVLTASSGNINCNQYKIGSVFMGGPGLPCIVQGTLNGSGTFNIVLADDHLIQPTGTIWAITVSGLATQSTYTSYQDVFGASINLTTLINSSLGTIKGNGLPVPLYYADTEMLLSGLGTMYYNLQDQNYHYCFTIPCTIAGNWRTVSTASPSSNFSAVVPGTNSSTTPFIVQPGSVVGGSNPIFSILGPASDTNTGSVVNIDTGASSVQPAFRIGIQGVTQVKVCEQAGPVGEVVFGDTVTCANISQSPFAKNVMMTGTAANQILRLYQGSTSATGTMLQLNNATVAGTGYKFLSVFSGVTGSNTGNAGGSEVFSVRGDGLIHTSVGCDNCFVVGTIPYVIGSTLPGLASSNQVYVLHPVPITTGITIPVNCTNTKLTLGTATTASLVLTLYKNGVSFGTATFAPAATTPTLSCAPTSFAQGDIFSIQGPFSADTTAANFGVSIYALR